MHDLQKFYINGQWVEPSGSEVLEVLNPSNEAPIATIRLGDNDDVEAAVSAATAAFPSFSKTSKEERIALLERIIDGYSARMEELAQAISEEMGAPISFARKMQVPAGLGHIKVALKLLKEEEFTQVMGTTTVTKEPIGVCALITPWNWPLNQITCKVAPALAVGCTMILKPSEVAPRSAHIFTEILHDAGVPAGVFNLVDGNGSGVGSSLSAHPRIDMISFTGSTEAGKLVSQAAAVNLKKVSLELGGKSANIVLDDVDFEKVISRSIKGVMSNSGQSCNAQSRLLVPASKLEESVAIAKRTAEVIVAGDPLADDTVIGPVVSKPQWDKIQGIIQGALDDGAQLVAGGLGLPDSVEKGYFVKPTVFSHVNTHMRIAQEEIFGPVCTIIPYETEEEAIAIANDSCFGLSGGVYSADLERAKAVASQMRTGMVHLNGAPADPKAPFGGFKESGTGREWGIYGMEEFLEPKSMFGSTPRV